MKLLSFGEILFDIDKEKNTKTIGGAPFNICAHLSQLHQKAYLLSAVGKDELGMQALLYTESFNIHARYIKEIDCNTGVCLIKCENGEPIYDLSAISAYDNIEVTENDIEKIKSENFDVFYFGTLAQRSKKSQNSLNMILDSVKFDTVFFDVNLRQNYFTDEIIEYGMEKCDILKINRSEYEYITKTAVDASVKSILKSLCEKYNIRMIILTLDSDGSALYVSKEDKMFFEKCKNNANLVSVVGAGDSFSACFLKNYLNSVPYSECLKKANAMGAYVVGFESAVPEYSQELLLKI